MSDAEKPGRWRVIRTGTMIPGTDQWTLFDGDGPPSTSHPSSSDRGILERCADLLNAAEAADVLS